ncbi:serine hydrolase domain-containing protein [Aquimarina sp. 2201CG14-23]|uniref:serine hydrolase domain-containing protein n=1 Tax=Aquimarina mycalae TaxID=3040073 RepID=UPI002477FBFD|nr:serine hydrolase domain-containing protein [Aquimarina sp. 2201CG14-23]MDH7447135.1 serine hydrolase domain-containing protein [Aquimarina sp. 2201CG14-23]
MIKILKLALMIGVLISCKQQSTTAQTATGKTIEKKAASTNKERIANYLDQLENTGFSGSVLVAQHGKILLEKGYGYADRENKVKYTTATVSTIGSITKQFTGAAILVLEMQGKLSVTDKLTKYFNNVPDDKKNITLHHLLTHSAGLPPAIGDDYEKITTDEFMNKAINRKLLFDPGTQYEYSNVGYSVLGIIIEKLSGMSYEEYLSENLWKPAGMYQTGYQLPSFDHIAVGYRKNSKWGRTTERAWATDGPFWHLRANGGVLSTPQDMYKWHTALLGNKILSDDAKAKFYGKHIEEGEGAGSHYGYGWAIFPTPRNTELIAHNGGNGVFFADFWRYLEEDITIFMMTNSVKRSYEHITSQIAGILLKPDFIPEVSAEHPNPITGEMADQLIADFMDTVNTDNKDQWKSFLERRTLSSFLNSFPMEEHLQFFNQFHTKLKVGKIAEVRLSEDEITLVVDTKTGPQKIDFNVILIPDGSLKIDGIRM